MISAHEKETTEGCVNTMWWYIGDINTKTGGEDFAGKLSLHQDTNINGRMLVQFATASTCGIPGENQTNKMNHAQISNGWLTSVFDVPTTSWLWYSSDRCDHW